MRRARPAAILAAVASACTCGGPGPPVLESISPARVHAGTAIDVTIRGSGFAPPVQADLEDPSASTVRGAIALTLVLAEQRVPLEQVAWRSERELSARVPPLATPATYDLELVDPLGQRAVLASAFAVDVAPGCGSDGTPCDDGNVCTQGDTCLDGVCAAGRSVCPDTAPVACLGVAPAAAAAGDAVALDASCSTDEEDPPAALEARIDFEGTGAWTPFAPIGTTWQHAYATPGLWVATVEVVDAGGLSDFASRYVLVTAPGDLVRVTTAHDESDPGASPQAPGGTGLSLREAIAYVNGLGAPRTILVSVAEPIVHGHALPPLVPPGAAIVGARAAPLEFPDVAVPCLTLQGADQLLLGATVAGCKDTAVVVDNASAGSQVAECTITPSPGGHGIAARASATIGPRNAISGAASALRLNGATFLVEENRIVGNAQGIVAVAGADLRVVRNRITSNLGDGIHTMPSVPSAPTTCTLLHNVLDANGGDGASLASFGGGVVVRNNLFTRNGGYGLRVGDPPFAIDHDGFFANARGATSGAAPGPTDVLADPRYAGDHRLSPDSPAIDRGIDTGLDVNGPAAGDYFGGAPDLGAWEAPYPAP